MNSKSPKEIQPQCIHSAYAHKSKSCIFILLIQYPSRTLGWCPKPQCLGSGILLCSRLAPCLTNSSTEGAHRGFLSWDGTKFIPNTQSFPPPSHTNNTSLFYKITLGIVPVFLRSTSRLLSAATRVSSCDTCSPLVLPILTQLEPLVLLVSLGSPLSEPVNHAHLFAYRLIWET